MNKFKNCICLLLMLVMIFAASCGQNDEAETEAKSTKTEANINKVDPEEALERRIEETKHLQGQRKELLDGMLEGGLATRIENPNGQPFVYVTQPFYMLTQDEQASMMNVLWYYFITEDRDVDVLSIYDNDTGNQIGTFGRKGLLIAE
ncbi:MAG: hypothetical protein DHS20C13_01280 [Thermodesulfobacteriota bacterium]|nr:MAG: hypothetical protein DHS20C13_01280 [Thermodesulfobacteriota bacterium]